jgi:MoxR-like ATPase
VNSAQDLYTLVRTEVDKAVVGKSEAKAITFAAFLAGGNVLLEGVPGIAKTLLARAFSRALGLRFSRVQFTPDLMPTDILGTSIYNQGSSKFEFIAGPIFSDFVLADEINRAPAKTQAALLEAMEERQVSIDNATYRMPDNFIVFATQNPVEFEGTYSLPEAQLDRFMVRILLDYPGEEEETAILTLAPDTAHPADLVAPVREASAMISPARRVAADVVVDDKVVQYVRDLIRSSRNLDELLLGNSPRAGQMLLRLSRFYAAIQGHEFVTPDHIRELVPSVLPHRWILKPEAEISQTPIENILRTLFDSVQVPA